MPIDCIHTMPLFICFESAHHVANYVRVFLARKHFSIQALGCYRFSQCLLPLPLPSWMKGDGRRYPSSSPVYSRSWDSVRNCVQTLMLRVSLWAYWCFSSRSAGAVTFRVSISTSINQRKKAWTMVRQLFRRWLIHTQSKLIKVQIHGVLRRCFLWLYRVGSLADSRSTFCRQFTLMTMLLID